MKCAKKGIFLGLFFFLGISLWGSTATFAEPSSQQSAGLSEVEQRRVRQAIADTDLWSRGFIQREIEPSSQFDEAHVRPEKLEILYRDYQTVNQIRIANYVEKTTPTKNPEELVSRLQKLSREFDHYLRIAEQFGVEGLDYEPVSSEGLETPKSGLEAAVMAAGALQKAYIEVQWYRGRSPGARGWTVEKLGKVGDFFLGKVGPNVVGAVGALAAGAYGIYSIAHGKNPVFASEEEVVLAKATLGFIAGQVCSRVVGGISKLAEGSGRFFGRLMDRRRRFAASQMDKVFSETLAEKPGLLVFRDFMGKWASGFKPNI